MNTINNNFIKAITNKPGAYYKAAFDIGNNQIAITASYSYNVLQEVIQEIQQQNKTAKLIGYIKE